MDQPRIILASGSPRRKQLLKQLFDQFDVIIPDSDETIDPSLSILDNLQRIVYRKADSIRISDPNRVIIACDTMVIIDQTILGKPKDKDDAIRTLHQLSANTHQVISGVVVKTNDTTHYAYVTTNVYFNKLSDQTILDYVASARPMDKAGSYGIQDHDVNLVDHIDGDYDNVVGLPLHCLAKLLDLAGIPHKSLH